MFVSLVSGAMTVASASAQSTRQPLALVLIPGAGGIHPRDFLVVSEPIFQSAGLQTALTTSAGQAISLIAQFKGRGMRVVLVGMSLGAVRAAQERVVAVLERTERLGCAELVLNEV